MNILFLCNKSPYPAKEGGPIAMNMMIEGVIRAGHKVKVLAANSYKYSVDPESIPREYKAKTRIELADVDLRIKVIPAFLNLFTSRSYHIERFRSAGFKRVLERILKEEKFDVVQFEMLHVSLYLDTVRKFSNAKVILRAHNVEHLIWERITKNTRNPLKKLYFRHLSRTLKKYELSVINAFDGVVAITEPDAAFFRKVIIPAKTEHVTAIPFGIDLSRFPLPGSEPAFPTLFSIGSMDWSPNIEGITWFLEQVWPEVHRKNPELSFHIAGRHMPEWLLRRSIPRVIVVGEVPDSLEFMHSKSIMIVPLLSGSGIRIKIIEGMAAGKPIISTRVGAEGINCTDGKNIFLADTPEEFGAAILKAASDATLCRQVGANARKLAEDEYQADNLIRKLLCFYEKAGT